MVTNAIEFEAKVGDDWKISIPQEYREYLSSLHRVILLTANAGTASRNEPVTNMQTRIDAFNRLDGLLAGHNIDLDNIRSERLARQ